MIRRVLVLLLAGLASSGTILQYTDEEHAISHVLSGQPGVQVDGEFSYRAPEGTTFTTKYRAGEEGFLAEGEHLPVPPQETPEVAAARNQFMDALMHPTEEGATIPVALVGDGPIGNILEEHNRKRREPVTAQAYAAEERPTYPLYPAYPYYNFRYPVYPTYPVYSYYPYYHTAPSVFPATLQGGVYQPSIPLGHPVYRVSYPAAAVAAAAPAATPPDVPAAAPIKASEDEEAAALVL